MKILADPYVELYNHDTGEFERYAYLVVIDYNHLFFPGIAIQHPEEESNPDLAHNTALVRAAALLQQYMESLE